MTSSRTLVRAGLLGDIHAEHEALSLALHVFADEGVDRVLAVGDICDGPGDVDRCCALLAEVNAAVVRGNHERWLLAGEMRDLPEATPSLGSLGEEARAFLASLPATMKLKAAVGELMLCHGLGEDDMESVDPDDWYSLQQSAALGELLRREEPLVVVNGHTHRRFVWSQERVSMVNAGTLYRSHDPCFAILDLRAWEVRYFDLRGQGRGVRAIRGEATPVPPPRGMR